MISENNNKNYHVNEEHIKFYQNYFFDLLPEIYSERDRDHVLKEFLEIIGEQAAAMRQNIDDLWKNFFIDSCDEWVIPYIGDLVGTKIISNPASDNRVDVKKTIQWRKQKGTLSGIQSLTKTTAGVGVDVREFFRLCSRIPHLNYFNKSSTSYYTVAVRDQKNLFNIGTVDDSIPHTIDVRNPSSQKGWYNLKNIGLFVSMLNTYHVENVESLEESPHRYYFNSVLHKNSEPAPIPLYELNTKMEIPSRNFSQDPQKYFGNHNAFTIRINSVPTAVFELTQPSPIKIDGDDKNFITISSSSKFQTNSKEGTFVGLHDKHGIRLMEPRKFSNPEKQFVIHVYSYSNDGNLTEISSIDTSKTTPTQYFTHPDTFDFGKLVIGIELGSAAIPSKFPETIISIRDTRTPIVDLKYSQKNSLDSIYKNSLYVYLPSVSLPTDTSDKEVYFFVDSIGSTYFAKKSDNKIVLDKNKLPTDSLGQVFPPRTLNFSLDKLDGYAELNRVHGIQLVDPSKFHDDFVAEAFVVNESRTNSWKIGELEITPDSSRYVNSKEVWIRWKVNKPSGDSSKTFVPIEWITNFKSIREKSKIPSFAISPENVVNDEKFVDILFGNKQQQQDVIKEIVKDALGYLKRYVSDIDCRLTKKSDDPKNCTEFDVDINLSPTILDDPIENLIQTTIDDYPLFDNEGSLFLKVLPKKTIDNVFPLCVLMIKNKNDQTKLVYLSQVELDSSKPNQIFAIAQDGSTFYDVINPYNLARKSVGQTIPIPDRYPLQQRIPKYLDLTNWENHTGATVLPGELAIDPTNGRFAFSEYDGIVQNVTADFNYAFGLGIGSGSYERFADEKSWDEKTLFPSSKFYNEGSFPSNYKWIIATGHGGGPNLVPSKTFRSLSEIRSGLADGDVIEITDNRHYEMKSPFVVPPEVKHLTIQGTNQKIPKIKLDEKNKTREFVIEGDFEFLRLYGLTFVGGKLRIKGYVKNLILGSCTINPDYDDGVSIIIDSEKATKTKVFLFKSIVGGISVSNPSTKFVVEDTIIENENGNAISVIDSKNTKTNFVLDVERSTIVSDPDSVLQLKELRASEVIFVGKTEISDSTNSWIRFSRYEPGSILPAISYENISKQVAYKCTTEKPLFISKSYGDPRYLNLHRLTSKEIIHGGEGMTSIGVYNKAYQFQRIKNLHTRLSEYLPFGIKKSLIHI